MGLGKFNEGFCVKVNTEEGSQKQVWIMCFDNEQTTEEWIQKLKEVF